ncbi:hypothetical protein ACFOHH_17250 [Shinella pollutisoli]|uniref:Phage tail protein n=3 Tax=Shinella pollutisoli TaxID=2250594 RepID=A0ABV7DIW2_9HYPH
MFGVRPFGNLSFGACPDPADWPTVFIGALEFTISTEYRIYAATEEWITGSDDIPADQPFSGALAQPLQFQRSIVGSDGFSGFVQGQGELVISNADGSYDFLPQFYALDGRDQQVRMGRADLPFRQWHVVFTGTATDSHIDETDFRISLQDYGYKLDVPLQARTYGGGGGIDGGADLAGKRKPRCLGYVSNLTPVLVRAQAQLYQVNDGPVRAVTAVYANGAPLGFAGDYSSAQELLAISIPEGRYATCLAEGLFRIRFLLDGEVITCDVEGDASGSGFAGTVGQVVRRILSLATVIADPDGLYLPSFAAYDAAYGRDCGYYADQNSSATVSEVLSLLVGFGGYIGFRRNGKLQIARFASPAGPPMMRFDDTHIRDIRREKLPSGLSPPPWRWRVGYGRNWTVQDSDVAGSVPAARRAFLKEEVRFAVAESNGVRTNHPFAQEREVGGYLRREADALAEAQALLAMHAAPASLYRLSLDAQPFGLEIGDDVLVTFPRFDLAAGRLLVVVEINENAAEDAAEIVGYG